jgi:hypothetical protein
VEKPERGLKCKGKSDQFMRSKIAETLTRVEALLLNKKS